MKKVFVFTTAFRPCIGGAEIALEKVMERLPEVQFVVFTARVDKTLRQRSEEGNVIIHRIGTGIGWLDKLRLWLKGPSVAESYGAPDAIWASMASYGGLAAQAYKKKHPEVHYLLSVQEGDSFARIYGRAFFVWPWFRRIFTRADRIHAISTFLGDWAKKMKGRNITVIPNGIEIEKANTAPASKSSVGLPADAQVVISVSRFVKKNGLEDVIRSMTHLDDNVHLLLVGDGALRPSLERLAQSKGLKERIHFLGRVENDKVYGYLQMADVFCRPSLSEGLGIAFLEAMAVSVPVVATPVGGIPDFLTDKQTGLLCDVGNPASIASAIQTLLEDSELRDNITKQSLKMVQETYTWDAIAKQTKDILL